MLVPELEYPFSVYVQSIANQQISDNIKVSLQPNLLILL